MPDGVARRHSEGHVPLPRRRKTKNPSCARSFSAAARFCARPSQAQEMLEEKFGVAADVWSVTSYKQLYNDGLDTERWNMLHPAEKPRVPYVTQCLADAPGVLVAATDYLKALPNVVSKWMPRRLASLGTDGFGRSESRASLARFLRSGCALHRLFRPGRIAARRENRSLRSAEGDPGTRNQPGKIQSPHLLAGRRRTVVADCRDDGRRILSGFIGKSGVLRIAVIFLLATNFPCPISHRPAEQRATGLIWERHSPEWRLTRRQSSDRPSPGIL